MNPNTSEAPIADCTLHPVVLFSSKFVGVPLRKMDFLQQRGCRVVGVVLEDEAGARATIDEFGKVIWIQLPFEQMQIVEKQNPSRQTSAARKDG